MSRRTLARAAGGLYLCVAVATGIAAAARAAIVVPGETTTTVGHLQTSATLFRVNIAADLASATAFLLTALALYLLLGHVSRPAGLAMVICVAVSVAIQSLNLSWELVALTLATDASTRAALGAGTADTLASVLIGAQHGGFVISQVFFGLWLVPLGYLVIRSGEFPRSFGYLLGAACVAYLIDAFVWLISPDVEPALLPVVAIIGALAELSFLAWLIVKAVPGEPVRPTRVVATSAIA